MADDPPFSNRSRTPQIIAEQIWWPQPDPLPWRPRCFPQPGPPIFSQFGANSATISLINAARPGGITGFVYATCYSIVLFGNQGTIRFTDANVDISSGGFLWGSKGVQVDQRTSKAQARWKRGLDVDTWTVVLAPRNVDPVSGATFPDTLLGQPWIAAARSGALDGADVQIDRAFMPSWPVPYTAVATPTGLMTVFAGRIAEVDTSDSTVVLTINDYRELLLQKMPRDVYSAQCRHTLFDTGCTLNPASFQVQGMVVANGSTNGTILETSLQAPPGSATFTLGKVVMTSGLNAGFSRTVSNWTAGNFQLLNPFPFTIAVGDTFTGMAGCSKTLVSCNLFSNQANYGGFPQIPQPETAV